MHEIASISVCIGTGKTGKLGGNRLPTNHFEKTKIYYKKPKKIAKSSTKQHTEVIFPIKNNIQNNSKITAKVKYR